MKSIKPIDHVKDVEKSLGAFCIIMCPCISFCLKGVLLKFQELLLFPTEYCALSINDVNITEFIRDKGKTIVWIICQEHMAALMRAPPASFLQNLTQIWSQMIAAHHIFNSSIVVYLYVVSPRFCLHNRAFKEQEVAWQKLLSGGGKHIWNDVGKEDLRWTFETCGEITWGAGTASGKTLSGDDLRRWVNISTALSNLQRRHGNKVE